MSPRFKKSRVLSKFLEFVVSETLEGNSHILKEYTIATEALNRSADFDPQHDGIVRIHANRLRKLLKQYYKNEGIHDPIAITIPKGRYIPAFDSIHGKDSEKQKVHMSEDEILESIPIIAVLPFKNFQKDENIDVVCSVLCHTLSAELTRFPEIEVISDYFTRPDFENNLNLGELATSLDADYLISGFCFSENNAIQINVELHALKEKKMLWAETYSLNVSESKSLNSYKAIIQKIMAKSCGFFGLIYRNKLNDHVPMTFDYLYSIYWHNRYHKEFSRDAFEEARIALDLGLEKTPKDALLNALKAELYLNLMVMDSDPEPENLRYGTQLVNKAISYDPMCQHAYQVCAWSNLLNHDAVEIYRTIDACLKINPNNPMYIGQMGFGYVCAGDYEKGFDLMSESIELNPFYPWNLNLGFCFCFLRQGDLDEAYYWAEKINRPKLIWDPLMRSSILGLLGRRSESEKVFEDLKALSPDFIHNQQRVVETFLFDPELHKRILEGLRFKK